jgi:xanthine dehydrogenase small subunit
MEAMLDEGASQCGFCSPGFVVSLTAYLIGGGQITQEGAVRAVEGNLCRCTGYGSIQRAGDRLVERFGNLPESLPERIAELGRAGVIPADIAALMTDIPLPAGAPAAAVPTQATDALTIGGGTDYYVRNPDPEPRGAVAFVDRDPALRLISRTDDEITLGASVTVQEFFENPIIRSVFPGIEQNESDFASLPIRSRATLAGNITNASPIGDMTAILLALRATVRIRSASGAARDSRGGASESRLVPLEEYFVSYRLTALQPGEYVDALILPVPANANRVHFRFEKVSKRRHLDIASANSACLVVADNAGTILDIVLSAGGVGPVPIRLSGTEDFLRGKRIDRETAGKAAEIASGECTPIDDVRGTAAYRRTLLGRFIWAHLMHIFPELNLAKELLL